ncbi:Alcohol dehydrogenase GroES-like protein [uncultured spirochete]|uniref:Alcohol dehydrogenase GroES-like protein n=1 Tax=uncultured spirochete TaxID=156406 RepID=A0A3P3XQX9_9SPIR|nr:Alcohol dehydrogenase GroES-like protein [uncultured spirochete]
MKAAVFTQFRTPLSISEVPDPEVPDDGVVLSVDATGICRSDWHGWQGHDPDIRLPHVPGHELAGTIVEVGKNIRNWKRDDRVTMPFVAGCGHCFPCLTGNQQVCDHQFQPGFTHWGSFAEFVAIHYADMNLVRLPDTIDSLTAASLGCRFATAFRALEAQAKVRAGEWVAVHGCGGVGLSAIMIAASMGARIIAVDIQDDKLAMARQFGADIVINAREVPDVISAIRDATDGGAQVSMDALGSRQTCFNSIACLAKRGRHVQVGLMLADQRHPEVPMDLVVARELEIYGSHGIQAHRYGVLLGMVASGRLHPERLVTGRLSLAQGIDFLQKMGQFPGMGINVITTF